MKISLFAFFASFAASQDVFLANTAAIKLPTLPEDVGIWIYEHEEYGNGKKFITEFAPNDGNGRNGALAWDDCVIGGRFDNGHELGYASSESHIGAFQVVGPINVSLGEGCGRSRNFWGDFEVLRYYTEADGKVFVHDEDLSQVYFEVTPLGDFGIWIYEADGSGKKFITKRNENNGRDDYLFFFRSNDNNGRNTALSWEDCGVNKYFNNGHHLRIGASKSEIEAFQVVGAITVTLGDSCALSQYVGRDFEVLGNYTEADGKVFFPGSNRRQVYFEVMPGPLPTAR